MNEKKYINVYDYLTEEQKEGEQEKSD